MVLHKNDLPSLLRFPWGFYLSRKYTIYLDSHNRNLRVILDISPSSCSCNQLAMDSEPSTICISLAFVAFSVTILIWD